MKPLFFTVILFCFLFADGQADTSQKIIEGRRNSLEQQKKPYVIMISADGFRYDYAEKYKAVHLQAFGKQGIKAKYMLPSYPTLTFPNHYTLVTGLYPSHHGLVSNSFYDPSSKESYTMNKVEKVKEGKWYGGTPLWVLAEQQQMLTASFYWVGSEAPIQGILPTYHYRYNEKIPIDQRIQVVVNWLELPASVRPHFISFYLPEVDDTGHSFGPDSPETGEAVRWVDTALHKLTEAVKSTGLDVNFIFVSDHGMTKVNTDDWIVAPSIDNNKVVSAHGGELFQLYVKNKEDIQPLYNALKAGAKNYSVCLKKDMPAKLHYGETDDVMERIGDILLVADWPYVFSSAGRKPKPGAHGFDPYKVKDMRTVFYAWGPAFKKNKTIASFENVNVYPVVTNILGLTYNDQIDGTNKLARKVLKK